MAQLQSELFRGNKRLSDCLHVDSAHVTPGSRGEHVACIQYAVLRLQGGHITGSEITQYLYGPATAALVLAYKTARKIINKSYQTKPDNIVGKMTIASLDAEMVVIEAADRMAKLRNLGR